MKRIKVIKIFGIKIYEEIEGDLGGDTAMNINVTVRGTDMNLLTESLEGAVEDKEALNYESAVKPLVKAFREWQGASSVSEVSHA